MSRHKKHGRLSAIEVAQWAFDGMANVERLRNISIHPTKYIYEQFFVGFIFACMSLPINKRERMLALMEQWRGSGQSRKEFCSLQGIKFSTFCYWIRRSKEQHKGTGFKQILPSQVSLGRIDIIYPNGVKVSADGDLSLIAKLIHLY